MTSLWLDDDRDIPTDDFEPDAAYDDVIVGAGLTGLVTALLFARRGHRVAVLEARTVGAVATGNSTAKVSLLQGGQLQKIHRHAYQGVVDAYVQGNREAFDWLVDYAVEAGVDVQRRDAYSYAATRQGLARVDSEYRVAQRAGLDVVKTVDVDLPFATLGAVVLRDQAQFDPMDVVGSLVSDIRALGGVVFENVRVTGVHAAEPVTTTTERGDVRSMRVHLTTGTPILDRGLYFAKVQPKRSYAMSFSGVGALPDGMFLSLDSPTRSVRTQGDLLLTGGNGHGVGRASSPLALEDDLRRWTESHWPDARLTHAWSAQDYGTPHGVPFVGSLPRGRGRVFLATGYDKWGMTNAVSAARMLLAGVLGEDTAWMTTIHHRVTTPVAMASGLGANVAVARWFATGWAKALASPLAPTTVPEDGRGVVGRAGRGLSGLAPVARSTVDGVTCSVSGVCPHLGGVLGWNDAEKSWDCPLHGSRFAADGSVLEGPTTKRLALQAEQPSASRWRNTRARA